MQVSTPRRFSLSTWAVNGWIGQSLWDKPGAELAGDEPLGKLGEVPAEAAKLGIRNLEVCHFHLPRTRAAELKVAAEAAGVHLYQLLIDDGDIADPENHERDLDWIKGWVDIAAEAGFARVRVIAGKTNPEGALERVTEHLKDLTAYAKTRGIRVVIENWFPLMSTPEAVLHVTRELGDELGLCFDFGNWGGDNKYADLGQIVHLAESCHAKCNFIDGKPDLDDFTKCLDLTQEVGFNGPYTLVHGETGSEWESLKVQLSALEPYI
jgi:sugar phosphate isomerase/epimerase